MSDNDRLAEIERLREAAGIPTPMRVVSFPGDEYGGTWELHLEGDTFDVWGRDYAEAYTAEIAVYLAALVNNADWLIAHVRELEAQAALDAEAREVVATYLGVYEKPLRYEAEELERRIAIERTLEIDTLLREDTEKQEALKALVALAEEGE